MTKKPDYDDPRERLARSNRADAERTEAVMLEGLGPSTEILELVTRSLAAEPERADLWMMRFEVQKTLGMKREFADALVLGWRHPRINRQLDWGTIRSMWNDLAPGEPAPDGITLPAAAASSSPLTSPSTTPGLMVTPPDGRRDRRFADMANRLARRELGVLAKAYAALQARPGFGEEFTRRIAPLLRRPTPLHFAEHLTKLSGNGNVRIFLKREDLRSVSPEMENATAQCYIATMLGRLTVISANDVDAHALALAEIAPRFSLKCVIVVRPGDLDGKSGLMDGLRGLGARIEVMPEGIGIDPRSGAVQLWQKAMGYAHLALSLGTGPSPYPAMASNFQALLGRETEQQVRAVADGRSRTMVAAVESEADSIGFMLPQLAREDIELAYAEPDPGGIASWRPSTRLRAYNGGIREHAWLRGLGRMEYIAIADAQATVARGQIERTENLKLSLEDARAVALVLLLAQRDREPRDYVVLVA